MGAKVVEKNISGRVRKWSIDIECLYIFQQQCPTGYFTCQSGSMSCIQESFKCDCSADCDDGSDETDSYAGCTNVAQCMLENGAG